MKAPTPFELFSALDDRTRTKLVLTMLRGAMAGDVAAVPWTTRTGDIPAGWPADLKVRFSVGGDIDRIAAALVSVLREGLVFGAGGIVMADGAQSPGLVADLRGAGALSVRPEKDGLRVDLVAERPLGMPEGLVVGKPSPFPSIPGGGFMATTFDGSLHLVGGWPGLSAREISATRHGRAALGLLRVTDGLMLIGLRIDGFTDGWAEFPFSLAIEAAAGREWKDAPHGGHSLVPFVLVESTDNVVRAVRGLRAPPSLTDALHELAAGQMDAMSSYDRPRYEADVNAAHAKWKSPNDVPFAVVAADV